MDYLPYSFIFLLFLRLASAQLPSTFPHNYTGIPSGDFSPAWQTYFQVKGPLPNITGSLPRSFAGNIPVNRAGHPNNTLFFWGFEKDNGSLTAAAGEQNDEPWLIWLNGGPGSSSLLGLMTENGPLRVQNDYSINQNNFSWDKLVDAFWIDQPVGTGYSTSDATGYVADEDQMGQDFLGFLSNLVKVFPSLATRPFYLTGESYAGTYIPYITKAIFSTPNPPVQLKKIAIGDGTLGEFAVVEELSTVTTLATYPQLIDYDSDVFNYFKTQEHLCGYDLNLTYPQSSPFPTLKDPTSTVNVTTHVKVSLQNPSTRYSWKNALLDSAKAGNSLSKRSLKMREESLQAWKRDLSGRPNGTLDPFYGCFLFEEMLDYASNFTFPWTLGGFDVYDIPDALNPEAPIDPSVFLNDNTTRSALHAPTSKDWVAGINYPFGSSLTKAPGSTEFGDPSVAPMAFLSELATNASTRGVGFVFYSGNDDSLVAHRGTEVIIQNMTFGGTQGFTRQPSTPWFNDNGTFAGIVHQERNVTYVLFQNAGHLVPQLVPQAAFVFLREFILGSNTTGLVNGTNVVGGEGFALTNDILPGTTVIFYGSGTTVSSTAAPSATLASWDSFIATAVATASAPASSTNAPGQSSAVMRKADGAIIGIYCIFLFFWLY